MIRFVGTLLLTTVVVCSGTVSANFLGQLRTAETSGLGSLNLQVSGGAFDDAFTIGGRARYGIASRVDLTGDLAILDLDGSDDLELILGGGFQTQLSDVDFGSQIDFALGGGFRYITLGDDRSSHSAEFDLIASRPLQTESGFKFEPYGRLNLRIDWLDKRKGTDSQFNIGFNLGAVVPLSGTVDLSGELQIDDQIGLIVGVNFLMW